MAKSKKFLDLLTFGYLNLNWDIGYGGYDEDDIQFFICRNIDKDDNLVDIEVRCNSIVVNVNMYEIYRTDNTESKYAAYIFNKLAARTCGNIDDYDLDGFMRELLFGPNCCDCEYQNDCEAWDEFYKNLEADHRKQRGRTAPNRAMCDVNSSHRKQRGRTAPNRALNADHRKQRGRTAPNGCGNCNVCNK